MIVPVILAAALAIAAPQKPAPVQKALHSVEWKDAAGDVAPINTSGGEVPGFDVVLLRLDSDGTQLTITATLKGPRSGTFASDVVRLSIDTDNNPATGVETFWSKVPGFEFQAELSACIAYADGGKACSGGLKGSKVKGYYAVASLDRFMGDINNKEKVVGVFDAPEVPVTGAVVSASLTYKALGVKPGQAIRIVARESGGPSDATADFPAVVLTLK